MAYTELRVHGMSGTPPRDLLYSDPVSYDRSDPFARIYEASRDGREVRAFHWGSLTSGSRVTAFWLLLSPFMLANLAGWMSSTRPLVQAFIRVTGLVITALLMSQGSVVLISHVNQIAATTGQQAGLVAGGAVILALLFLAVVWRLSTQSLLEPQSSSEKFRLLFGVGEKSLESPRLTDEERLLQVRDPAPGVTLDNPAMWCRQPVLERLRRQHLAIGVLMIPIALEVGRRGWGLVVVAGLVWLLIVTDTALISSSKGLAEVVRRASVMNVHLAWALLVIAVVRLFIGTLPDGADPWPGIHELVFYVAIVAGASTTAALISQYAVGVREWQQVFLPMSALSLAATVGGALGVAAALFVELASYRFLSDNPFPTGPEGEFDIALTSIMTNGGAWTVESMLCFVMAFVAFAAWSATRGPLGSNKDGRNWALLRCATRKAPLILAGVGVVAVGLALVAIVYGCVLPQGSACVPQELQPAEGNFDLVPWIAGVIAVMMFVGLALAIRRVSPVIAVLVPVLGGLAIWAVLDEESGFEDFSWTVPIIDLPVRPARFLDLSVVVIIFGITFFILRSIIGGFGDPEKRRKVGMLWDTGSFWPRWFHPLAPPSYSPHAVRTLNRALRTEATEILTAHSQGSVISSVALSQPGAPLPKAFVTYGSPLGILYDKLFPFTGVRRLVSLVDARWGDVSHWVNLWRESDPLGGAPIPCIDGNIHVAGGVGHSHYELTDEFFTARPAAVGGHLRTATRTGGSADCQ
jgi:hypothetical protein